MKKDIYRNPGVFLLVFVCLWMSSIALSAMPAASTASKEVLRFPLIFVKQFNYQGLHIYDTFYQWRWNADSPGGIYLLENPWESPENHRIRPIIDATTEPTLGNGIYSDPCLSFDAQKLLFCYKDSPSGNTVIYEIHLDGSGLRQLTNLDSRGNPYHGKGSGHHDTKPAYLPDGRIVFTSTRYSGLVPCANNGVAILHVMNADGSDLHTISVNNVTEFDPSVLPDGRILFGRWEYIDRNALVIQSLWSVYPDGTNETAFYANNMVFPEAILQGKPVPGDGHLVVGTFAPHNAPPRGSIAMVDISAGQQNSVSGKNDPAAIFNFEHHETPTHDRGDSCDPWAINENLVLYSGKQNSSVPNSILLIDRQGEIVEVLSDSRIDLHNPIPVVPRQVPPILVDQTDRSQKTGNFFVVDVYQGMPKAPRGSVKWLRVVEETSRVSASPGSNPLNQTFSISAALSWSPKIYHGIVPVNPDGSVFFEAPSGRAIYFQLLDKDYRLVRSMRTFVQAAPGTTRSCTGCHEYGPPRGATGQLSFAGRPPQKLQPESWGTGHLDYSEMIQPIFDQHCVSCHGGEKGIAAGLDLSSGPTELFNISYLNLTARREKQYHADLIAGVCCMNGTAHWSCKIFEPYSHGSGAAPLADRLLNDPEHKLLLSQKERELLFTWIDSNGLYFGTWNYTLAGPQLTGFQETLAELSALMQKSSCVQCHGDEKGRIFRFEEDWINLERPEMSRILRAPLPQSSDSDTPSEGWGIAACRNHPFNQNFRRLGVMNTRNYQHRVKPLDAFPSQKWTPVQTEGTPYISWESTENPVYQSMLRIIQRASIQAHANPRVDMSAAYEKGVVLAGRSRQILPVSLPETLPEAKVDFSENGRVGLSWKQEATTIGLVVEIHRSTTPQFTPTQSTKIAQTELTRFTDMDIPPGTYYYALIWVSDPAQTCGTCRLSCCDLSDENTELRPQKSEPVYLPPVTVAEIPMETVFPLPQPDMPNGIWGAPYSRT